VFVIHGVGNRDRTGFEKQVAELYVTTGSCWPMKAVYWGDLGAEDRWIGLTVPSLDQPSGTQLALSEEIRSDGELPPHDFGEPVAQLAATLLMAAPSMVPIEIRGAPDDGPAGLVAAGAVTRLASGPAGGEKIRDVAQVAAMREVITEHLPSTVWLRQVTNPPLLREIGAAIAAPLDDPAVALEPGAGEELREEVRGIDVHGFVKRRMDEIDRLVGATIGSLAGRLNTFLRTEQGPGVTRFIGDVLVYQRRRKEIHERVRSTIEEVDPALGRDSEHPVNIIGHSLGGVIAVDMATADEPLWTRSLVTFGSQSPFFHVCDPRGGQLLPYSDGHLVQLPPSLGAWTNLWEPMDVLAFIAAKVFRMHDGTPPIDRPVAHLTSSGLWTHSAYWELSDVAADISHALGAGRMTSGPLT
jgi:hypothetical protein